MTYDYDLFVIGGGSGGVRASRIASGYGAKVGLAEGDRVGGTCVIRGCVPKKLLVYASSYKEHFEDAIGFGWEIDKNAVKLNWGTLIKRKNAEIDRLNNLYKGILERNKVELIPHFASFEDPHTLRVGDRVITAKTILISTGASPSIPTLPGSELFCTSNDALEWLELPPRIAVYGAGYIGVELSQVFLNAGSKVSLIYRNHPILRGFDQDLRDAVAENLVASGMDLRLDTEIASLSQQATGILVTFKNGETMEVDKVLAATGRSPNIHNLGLDKAGVKLGPKGEVMVDDWSRTNVEHIYAVGDVTDRMALTPVAINEGHAFADTVFGSNPRKMDYHAVASAVFSQPPAGACGLTESEVIEKYGKDAYDVYITKFRPMKHTLTGRSVKTTMKLIVEKSTDLVLGVHLVGEEAAELIQMASVAMKCKATKAQFDSSVGVHPTSAEELVTLRTKRS